MRNIDARRIRSALLLATIGAAGTTFAAPPSLDAQEVVDLPDSDRPINANFDEVYRIGSFDGEVWETFGEVAGTAFDAAGNLYIMDRQANQITVVDSQGSFVRTIGRPGEGPGEFRMAMVFAVFPDGRVVVADLGHRSFQIFGADGEFERMVAMSMDGETLRLGAMQPDASGLSFVSGAGGTVVAIRQGGPGGGPDGAPEGRPIERVSLEGETAVAETLVTAWAPPPGEEGTMEGGGVQIRMAATPRTFEPDLLVGALPDGSVAYSDSTTYRIEVLSPTGVPVRVLRRPFEPEPVTRRVEDAERERQLTDLEEGEGPRMRMMVSGPGGGPAQSINQDAINDMMRNRIEQMTFYHEVPVLMRLETSWGGAIWAQRRGESPNEPGAIDVLTASGDYIGTFGTGETVMPSAFGPDGLAAYIETDDFDVPVVVVRRLPGRVN